MNTSKLDLTELNKKLREIGLTANPWPKGGCRRVYVDGLNAKRYGYFDFATAWVSWQIYWNLNCSYAIEYKIKSVVLEWVNKVMDEDEDLHKF